MTKTRVFGLTAILFGATAAAFAQTWQPLINQPSFDTDTALLLTDGRVMMHQLLSPNWWALTPDNTGSYVNGTWTELASLPSIYGPQYFASAVLSDGRLIIEGGENNLTKHMAETNQGAIYDPTTNTWTSINPPKGWTEIGDSPGLVLANGTFMLCQNLSTQVALLNAQTLTWAVGGTGKADECAEEGMVLLPDQSVLTVDIFNTPYSEKFIPSAGKWVTAGSTVVQLVGIGPFQNREIGPMVLRPDGTVFAMGANGSGAGHTSIYTPPSNPLEPGTWTAGPDFPNGDGMADAPAAILPDGNVLCDTAPFFGTPSTWYEFDGTQFSEVPGPASAASWGTVPARLLVLPTGQVLYSIGHPGVIDVEVYTPSGSANPAWAPSVTTYPSVVTAGSTYAIRGTQFNGVSGGAAYGDDAEMFTNYPLVRITNVATGHVFYARTHNHATMGVATGRSVVGTRFDVPVGIETGASTLDVVANGIASTAVNITVQ